MILGPDLPRIEQLEGRRSGPILAVLGGVHGDELEGVLAIRTLMGQLDPQDLAGTVRWAAPAHPAAWQADSRTGPADGMNLARVFPGDPAGSPTEQVAAHLTSELITGADLLVDLHSAGRGFDMPLLVGYHSSGPLADRAACAAEAFAAPLVWQHPPASPGRSLSAAESLGVPSVYVEGHGGGQVRRADLDAYIDGLRRLMAHLGMLTEAPTAPPFTVVRGDGNTDEGITARAAGFFVTAVDVSDRMTKGQALGRIVDQQGSSLVEITAPQDGIVMLLRRSARVQTGDTLAIVAGVVGADPGVLPGGAAGEQETQDRSDRR